MRNVSIFLIVLLFILIGILYLQYRLSKLENKKIGLILPAISFGISLIYILNIFVGYGSFSSMNGTVANSFSLFIIMLITLVMWNIPTLILIMIYLIARDKMKKDNELDKMNIQDL